MPLQELDFPFSGGVDEKTQTQIVEPGSVLGLSNLRQLKNGSYQKQDGATSVGLTTIAGGNLPNDLKKILAYKDELLATDGINLYTRGATASAWKQVRGYVPKLSITGQPTLPLQYLVVAYDITYINGYYVIAYAIRTSASGLAGCVIFGTVVDASNGAIVSPPISISGKIGSGTILPLKLVVVKCGTRAFVTYTKDLDAAPSLLVSYLDVASNSTIDAGWSVPFALVADPYAAFSADHIPAFDVCELGNNFVIAYINRNSTGYPSAITGTNILTVTVFDTNMAQINQTTVAACSGAGTGVVPTAVSVSGDPNDNIWVAFVFDGGDHTGVVGLDATTLVQTASSATVIITGVSGATSLDVTWTGNGTGRLVLGNDGLNNLFMRDFNVVAGATNPLGTTLKAFYTVQACKQFSVNGRWYMGIRYSEDASLSTPSPHPNDLWLVDVTQTIADQLAASSKGYLRYAGNINPRLSYGMPVVDGYGCHVAAVSSSRVVMPAPALKNAVASSLDLMTLDYAPISAWQPTVLGETLAMTGAPTSYYDGTRIQEIGFAQRPKILTNTCGTPSGAGLDGAYKYIAIYEQVDARGQWHPSNVSDAYLANPAPAGGQSVIVHVRPLRLSNRMDLSTVPATQPNQVRVVLYRTTVGGTVYYRVPNSELINDPGVDTMTMGADETLDVDLGAALYTQPEVPNTAQVKQDPPAFTCMIPHANRLVGVIGKSVWYSGTDTFGEGYWFTSEFQFQVETPSDLTGAASLDGALVLFTRDRVAFVDGSGPPDNGAGGGFSDPSFIAAEVGCINYRSIVVTPAGVVFQSLRGLELLTRGRSLAAYFGSAVEDTLRANPVITSAVLDEYQSTVTFTCQPTEISPTGVRIIWDFLHTTWQTSLIGNTTFNVRSATMVGQQAGTVPVRYELRHNGVTPTITQASSSTYLDVGNYVNGKLTTPWVKMAGLQGYGRTTGVSLLMANASAHDLEVKVRLDYRSGVEQTRTFTAAEIAALRDPKQLWMYFITQKCEAFQLEITDLTPSSGAIGTGQGPVLIGLRIEYKQKAGVDRHVTNIS